MKPRKRTPVPSPAPFLFAELHPHPGRNSLDRLRHTVEIYDGQHDEEWAVVATADAYPEGGTTGLTWGDLRRLLVVLETANTYGPEETS